ncbi:MAG: aminoglycoside 3'-phosphotransferase [Oscillospiraceae bacterium]|nr:aminoglycoside 3'-phosphotransferase [Oscillospiraceae bacterium]
MKDFRFPKEIDEFIAGKNYYIDETGMSDSSVLIFDDMVLKIQPEKKSLKNEHEMMGWLKNKISVPKILCDVLENGLDYTLMTKIPGKMSCEEEYMSRPEFLVSVLSDALKMLWEIDISDCPVKNDLSTVLCEAEYRVEHGFVDVDDAEPETFGKNGYRSPEELLKWLCDNRPEEDFVLSHGDFCLPNIFIADDKFSGFVDVGRTGVADRYQDIALCFRSLRHNFDGTYCGKSYGGYADSMLFDALGLKPDFDKIRYYILLDELF